MSDSKQHEENQAMKKILNALKNAANEAGDDWENIVQKLGQSDVGSPSGMEGDEGRGRRSEKRKKISDMKKRMKNKTEICRFSILI
jgi:hypothetical protein